MASPFCRTGPASFVHTLPSGEVAWPIATLTSLISAVSMLLILGAPSKSVTKLRPTFIPVYHMAYVPSAFLITEGVITPKLSQPLVTITGLTVFFVHVIPSGDSAYPIAGLLSAAKTSALARIVWIEVCKERVTISLRSWLMLPLKISVSKVEMLAEVKLVAFNAPKRACKSAALTMFPVYHIL